MDEKIRVTLYSLSLLRFPIHVEFPSGIGNRSWHDSKGKKVIHDVSHPHTWTQNNPFLLSTLSFTHTEKEEKETFPLHFRSFPTFTFTLSFSKHFVHSILLPLFFSLSHLSWSSLTITAPDLTAELSPRDTENSKGPTVTIALLFFPLIVHLSLLFPCVRHPSMNSTTLHSRTDQGKTVMDNWRENETRENECTCECEVQKQQQHQLISGNPWPKWTDSYPLSYLTVCARMSLEILLHWTRRVVVLSKVVVRFRSKVIRWFRGVEKKQRIECTMLERGIVRERMDRRRRKLF